MPEIDIFAEELPASKPDQVEDIDIFADELIGQDTTQQKVEEIEVDPRKLMGASKEEQDAFIEKQKDDVDIEDYTIEDSERAKVRNSIPLIDKRIKEIQNQKKSQSVLPWWGRPTGMSAERIGRPEEDPEEIKRRTMLDSQEKTAKQVRRYMTAIASGDKKNSVAKFWDGLKTTDLENTITAGFSKMVDDVEILGLSKKLERDGFDSLNEDEKGLLTLNAIKKEVQSMASKDRSFAVGSGIGETLPFISAILLTGGAGGATSSAIRGGATSLGRKAVAAMGDAAVRAALMPSTYGGGAERMTPKITTELDIVEKGEGATEAMLKSYGSNVLEVFSEVGIGKGLDKLISKANVSKIPLFKDTKIGDVIKKVAAAPKDNKFLKAAAINNPITENLEELFTGVTQPILTGDGTPGDFFERENLIRTFLTTSIVSFAGGAPSQAKAVLDYNRANKGRSVFEGLSPQGKAAFEKAIKSDNVEDAQKSISEIDDIKTGKDMRKISDYYASVKKAEAEGEILSEKGSPSYQLGNRVYVNKDNFLKAFNKQLKEGKDIEYMNIRNDEVTADNINAELTGGVVDQESKVEEEVETAEVADEKAEPVAEEVEEEAKEEVAKEPETITESTVEKKEESDPEVKKPIRKTRRERVDESRTKAEKIISEYSAKPQSKKGDSSTFKKASTALRPERGTPATVLRAWNTKVARTEKLLNNGAVSLQEAYSDLKDFSDKYESDYIKKEIKKEIKNLSKFDDAESKEAAAEFRSNYFDEIDDLSVEELSDLYDDVFSEKTGSIKRKKEFAKKRKDRRAEVNLGVDSSINKEILRIGEKYGRGRLERRGDRRLGYSEAIRFNMRSKKGLSDKLKAAREAISDVSYINNIGGSSVFVPYKSAYQTLDTMLEAISPSEDSSIRKVMKKVETASNKITATVTEWEQDLVNGASKIYGTKKRQETLNKVLDDLTSPVDFSVNEIKNDEVKYDGKDYKVNGVRRGSDGSRSVSMKEITEKKDGKFKYGDAIELEGPEAVKFFEENIVERKIQSTAGIALKNYLWSKNKNTADVLEQNNGFDAYSLSEVEGQLSDTQKALGDLYLDLFSKHESELKNAVESRGGAFKAEENYITRSVEEFDLDKDFRNMSPSEHMASVVDGITKDRRNHRKQLKIETEGINEVFDKYIGGVSRVISNYDVVDDVNTLLNNDKFQKVTKSANLDKAFREATMRSMGYGAYDNSPVGRKVSQYAGVMARINLAFKPWQVPKQYSSFLSGVEHYSPIKGTTLDSQKMGQFMLEHAFTLSKLNSYHKMFYEKSPEYKKRWDSWYRANIDTSIDDAAIVKKASSLLAGFSSAGMTPTKYGDMLGVIGGYAPVYESAIRNGKTQEQALEMFEKYDKSQQAQSEYNRTNIQSKSLAKFLTLYKSSNIAYMNKVMQSKTKIVNDIRNKKFSWKNNKKDVYKILLYRQVLNGLFQAIGGIPGLYLKGDDPDKMKDYLLSLGQSQVLGNANALLLTAQELSAAYSLITGTKYYGDSMSPAHIINEIVDPLIKAATGLKKKKELEEKAFEAQLKGDLKTMNTLLDKAELTEDEAMLDGIDAVAMALSVITKAPIEPAYDMLRGLNEYTGADEPFEKMKGIKRTFRAPAGGAIRDPKSYKEEEEQYIPKRR